MALIDIHTHILYGVDDGAKDINDSMGLLDEEREQGVDQVILTPHYGPKFGHPDTEVLRKKFEAIREKAYKYYPEIQLYLGSELYYQQGTVSDLKQGKALTMNGTRYVLVEFATSDAYSHIYRAVQDFVYAGYIPILAHVERYKAVFGHVDKIVELVETGAYIQINAESLIGGIFLEEDYERRTGSFSWNGLSRFPDKKTKYETGSRSCTEEACGPDSL